MLCLRLYPLIHVLWMLSRGSHFCCAYWLQPWSIWILLQFQRRNRIYKEEQRKLRAASKKADGEDAKIAIMHSHNRSSFRMQAIKLLCGCCIFLCHLVLKYCLKWLFFLSLNGDVDLNTFWSCNKSKIGALWHWYACIVNESGIPVKEHFHLLACTYIPAEFRTSFVISYFHFVRPWHCFYSGDSSLPPDRIVCYLWYFTEEKHGSLRICLMNMNE